MKVPNDVKCGVCQKVFCCAECRYRHELKSHAIMVHKSPSAESKQLVRWPHSHNFNENRSQIFLFCPLCEQKALALHHDMYIEMLEHIVKFHMPLRCKKCSKTYSTMDDLKEFSKCLPLSLPKCCKQEHCCCQNMNEPCETIAVNENFAKITISTQTSPMQHHHAELNDTPISIVNVRWKAKGKILQEEFVSDSGSSIKNISSINGSMRRSLEAATSTKPKATLVRTTSTPVHAELLCIKQTEGTFDGSGGQVSSIYNSGTETDHSPSTAAVITGAIISISPKKQHLESVNRYFKVGGGRGKLATVTPLRQVMSKSIQKAFAEHGGLPPVGATSNDWQLRKKIFDSNSIENNNSSSVGSPLDLRLSPALRRTESDILTSTNSVDKTSKCTAEKQPAPPPIRREILLSSQKLTRESIVITRTQHLASMETASNDSNDNSKYTEQSMNTANNSGLSGASSIYKTCHSVEIITSTTALSEMNVQKDFYVAENGSEKKDTLSVVTRTASNNLVPLTPISRIPGAVINKKLIRFDSPQEEAEIKFENENKAEIEPNVELKISLDEQTPGESKFYTDVECSTADVFFTPNATPVRKSMDRLQIDNSQSTFTPVAEKNPEQLRMTCTTGRLLTTDCVKTLNNAEEMQCKKNDEVLHPKSTTPKDTCSEASLNSLGRSWSFSALLGSVLRLPSLGKCNKNKIESSGYTKNEETDHRGSLIKRCASIAGSLVGPRRLIDDKQLGNLKRKRSYTIDLRSTNVYKSNPKETTSPLTDSAISTKRFRIQGRKPIERMRQNSDFST